MTRQTCSEEPVSLTSRAVTRRGFLGVASFGLFAGPQRQPIAPEKPVTFKATVKDGGTQPTDPVRYLELHFQDDPSQVVVMGPPESPFIRYLWGHRQRRQELTLVVSAEPPAS